MMACTEVEAQLTLTLFMSWKSGTDFHWTKVWLGSRACNRNLTVEPTARHYAKSETPTPKNVLLYA
jgi:hypothetical protein